jgi:hypothetical protein
MTTAIVLKTSEGELGLGLALGPRSIERRHVLGERVTRDMIRYAYKRQFDLQGCRAGRPIGARHTVTAETNDRHTEISGVP